MLSTILSGRQVARLRAEGIELAPKRIEGKTVAERATMLAADGRARSVFHRLSPPGFSISTSSAPGIRFCRGQRLFGFRCPSSSGIGSSSRSSPMASVSRM